MTQLLLSIILLASVATLRRVDAFGMQPFVPTHSRSATTTCTARNHRRRHHRHHPSKITALCLSSSSSPPPPPGSGDNEEEPKLILDANQVQEQMNRLKSKYPTSEADYLAAARKRAEMKVESVNNQSTDDDWKRAAEEKRKQKGGTATPEDDWEASLEEAGNEDAQILIPVDIIVEDGNTSGDEPTLLL